PKRYSRQTREWDWSDEHLRAQAALIREARIRGVTMVMASPWSPPAWMKTNGKTQKGGSLKAECYADYARYLLAYVKGMKEQFGVDIDVLSLQNESDETKKWECCKWTARDQTRFLRDYIGPLKTKWALDVRLLANEATEWDAQFKSWILTMLNDPQAAPYLDIVGGHRYRKPAASAFPEVWQAGKRLWMTEYYWEGKGPLYLQNARVIHNFMVKAQVNAYLFWWLFARPDKSTRARLILFDEKAGTFSIHKHAYALGQYSRFIRPGYHRVDVKGRLPDDLLVSAYREPAGSRVVVVAVNLGADRSISIEIDGVEGLHWRTWQTSRTENMTRRDDVKPETMFLQKETIVTLVGEP
ncbi:MAG: hypothetical protein D6820_07040, partial [Lentisphaerae bacterium]